LKENEMTQAIEEKNKAFVLEAFETLFNKRDYAAAERFWSPSYIQHSAHIPPGREGLFAWSRGFRKISATRTGSSPPMATMCCSTAALAT
jgi:predicted SnoaL-like aldol condensation-catalyzing enzyme